MLIDIAPPKPTIDRKRMIETRILDDGRFYAAINYSSLDVINTCMRKSSYQLEMGLVSNVESAPTLFGKAVHKAMEHWYTLPIDERQLTSLEADRAELMAYGHGIDMPAIGALESIRQFVICAEQMRNLPDSDKRSLSNGIKILMAYFKHYADDKLEVLSDEKGPFIERHFQFRMHEDANCIIDYHGTVDMLVKHIGSGEIMVLDHKTSYSLGREFINRAKPNHQFTGYVWGAQQMGVDTNKMLINGIQVAKTKCEFLRIATDRDDNDIAELHDAVVWAVKNYARCMGTGIWPMAAPTSCNQWGGCQYLDVCQSPRAIRRNILEARWSAK